MFPAAGATVGVDPAAAYAREDNTFSGTSLSGPTFISDGAAHTIFSVSGSDESEVK